MELYQADEPAEATAPGDLTPDQAITLPPFPVLLRIPNFAPRGRSAVTVKSMTVVESRRARRGKGNGRILVRTVSVAFVLLIVGAMATLLHQRPEWFKPRMALEPATNQTEELLVMPLPPPPAPAPAEACEMPVLSVVEEAEAPPAALLEPQIVPLETGDSP